MSAVRALPIDELVEEAQRVLSICNACRYCEGYCAVFPALERRLEFVRGGVSRRWRSPSSRFVKSGYAGGARVLEEVRHVREVRIHVNPA